MEKKFFFIFLLIIYRLTVCGQNFSEISVELQKMKIDSMVKDINNKPELSIWHLIGNCVFGEFNGIAYYNNDSLPVKIFYEFGTDSSGSKIFYYRDTTLIKVVDKGVSLYNTTKGLIYANESLYDSLNTKKLLKFSYQFRNILKK